MNKLLLYFLSLLTIISCSTNPKLIDEAGVKINNDILNQAEASASKSGRKILEVSRGMISSQEVVVGGCWDYINAVYKRAGYPSNKVDTIFKSKIHGPYFNPESVQAGDWLYFMNHSYHNIEHSAVFVSWYNFEKKEALMVNYPGEKRAKPASYKIFTLDNIYNVFRAHE